MPVNREGFVDSGAGCGRFRDWASQLRTAGPTAENISLYGKTFWPAKVSPPVVFLPALSLSGFSRVPVARPDLALCCPVMPRVEARRACRHDVTWPARVRSITESRWHTGQVVNLSVTGVLLQLDRVYDIGERVEVEIEFLTQPQSKTVVSGVGYVVREHAHAPYSAAIHFDLGCRPAPRTTEPAVRDARL